MRYLKTYNEELKPDTYKSAADKLSQMGHVKRPEELMKWYEVTKEKEKQELKRKSLEEASKLGTYKLTLSYYEKNKNHKFTGDFYIYFQWNDDLFNENYFDWKDGYSRTLWLNFSFAILPASEESTELINNVFSGIVNKDGKSYIGNFSINLSDSGSEEKLNPNGVFHWENWDEVSDFYLSDRGSAQKFKKLLYDIFKGDVVLGDTPELPGGLKEKVLDHLCSDLDHTLEEYEEFMESLKKISLNKLYKD
jgi:hypothetical protein